MCELVNLSHRTQHLGSQFRIAAEHARRRVSDGAHTTKRSDKKKLHPERHLNVGRDLRVESGTIECLFDGHDSIAASIV